MRCNNCGSRLRIGTEQVGVDSNGLPVIHRFGYCDNCRTKWDLDLTSQSPTGNMNFVECRNQQNPSNMGTVAMVCGIIGLLLTMIFIGIIPSVIAMILGIVCIVENKPNKKRAFIGITLSGISFFLFLVMTVFVTGTDGSSRMNANQDKEITTETQQNINEVDDEKDFVSQLSEYIDISVAEKANDIIINQLNFSEVEFREKMGETTNFEIALDGVLAVLTASDDVYRIFIPDSDYVFYEDGAVKMTAQQFNDVTIDSYEQTAYYSIAQEIVESYLKSPKSADFPSIAFNSGDIGMKKSGDIVVVQGYVDAENSFGAKIRSQYTVEFKVTDLDSFSYELIYTNIDGKTSGTYIEI